MKKIASKSLFLLLVVSCFLIGSGPLPAQGYNSGDGSSPNGQSGHPWITNKAIEYLKVIAPDAYMLANQYREQLIRGAWYADHNSRECEVPAIGEWNCDSTNHYEPKFHYILGPDFLPLTPRLEASASAAAYASDLFSIASTCWSSRDLPESSLPDECQVPQWRAVDLKNFPDRLKDATKDGPPIRKSPLTLLGWALHMVQDVTQVYHTYREGLEGHQEFEDDVDEFIEAGNGERLPSDTSKAPLEVAKPQDVPEDVDYIKEFVEAVASETRETRCCPIREQLDTFTEFSLNRAIIYSAKLLSFYFRQHGATELYNAVLMVVVF